MFHCFLLFQTKPKYSYHVVKYRHTHLIHIISVHKAQGFFYNPKHTALGMLKNYLGNKQVWFVIYMWVHLVTGNCHQTKFCQIQYLWLWLKFDKAFHFSYKQTLRSMYTGHRVSRDFCATLNLWTVAKIVFMTGTDCALCKPCVEAKETVKHQASLIAIDQLHIFC